LKLTAHEHAKQVTSLRSQAITVATVNGAAVDRAPATEAGERFLEALVVIDVGALGGTTPSLDVKVQETVVDPAVPGSPLAAGWGDITGALFPQFVTATGAKNLVGRINLQNRKRFLRMVAVGAGTSPTGAFCGIIILLAPDRYPVTQIVTASFNIV
jgi:hypothetical protein